MPNNYILLETIALTQSAASVTFDNLPTSGYTDLKVVISSRQSVSEASGGYYFDVTFNGTTANRSGLFLRNHNGTVTSATYTLWGLSNPSDYTANTFSSCELYVPNYRSSNFKSASLDSVNENNGTGIRQILATGLWSNTAAITSITFTPGAGTFDANSTFSLYGVAALGTTPVLAPKATGGNIVANDGTYWYHAFTKSGNFVPQTNLTADVLVVAGGGGGGASAGGGGGAGGLLAFTNQSLTPINYACTVGAGGPANGINTDGTNGVNSQFASLTAATGGGGGASNQSGNPGKNGGSGGGGATFTGNQSGGMGTLGQGNNGAAGNNSGPGYGGGGGGANAAGNTAAGGNGSLSYSAWGLATLTGQNVSGTVYFAGGGGGSRQNSSAPAATGGFGGGAAGALTGTNAIAAIANTGGGGGGGWDQGSALGSNGGSGIVIIRYPIA